MHNIGKDLSDIMSQKTFQAAEAAVRLMPEIAVSRDRMSVISWGRIGIRARGVFPATAVAVARTPRSVFVAFQESKIPALRL